MTFSVDSTSSETEADKEDARSSRFVVGPDQLRRGDFKTLDDVRSELQADDE